MQSDRYADILLEAFETLCRFPDSGWRTELFPNGRIYQVEKHKIVYRRDASMVRIVRILHEKMDIRRHLS